MKRLAIAVSALTLSIAALSAPAMVSAWGNTGHRLIGVAAVRGLPEELPAFLRTPGAAAEVEAGTADPWLAMYGEV